MSTPTTESVYVGDPEALRQAAIVQLRKKRGLQAHALAYVAVNLFLNAIWLVTDPGGFYWPVFPLLGWGIGLAFNIWDVYSYRTLSEERIQREMARLRDHT
ncbi:MAG TPA: 2TM domain-containing protein [Micromonosporaceae bacterium]|nr:2TM domain-containing protein [Micromonosporaceae bacterium]